MLDRILICLTLPLALAACKTQSTVRVTNEKPVAAVPQSRSEPIFYNGRTYQLDFRPASAAGAYDMTVGGMSAKQQKDAVAVATSSLGYYACPDGQRGKLTVEPSYSAATWRMQARCG